MLTSTLHCCAIAKLHWTVTSHDFDEASTTCNIRLLCHTRVPLEYPLSTPRVPLEYRLSTCSWIALEVYDDGQHRYVHVRYNDQPVASPPLTESPFCPPGRSSFKFCPDHACSPHARTHSPTHVQLLIRPFRARTQALHSRFHTSASTA